ncbi:MAG: tRNA pseudouridine(38-40) synthase TruA [Verrucomicrobiaceae bacterium]|nr:MAG: tRNA pseudouridine(38-40) synthase TruA [Verrucomicrobiaceae bacterium]
MSTEIERLRLLLAYDGRPFRGWQSQVTKDAIQDYLEAAAARITGTEVTVHGSGRTDAGVHALGQVAHMDVPRGKMPVGKWQLALNGNLPPGVKVLSVTRAASRFHARFDARGKIYTYRIWNESFLHPLEIGRAWHVPGTLDLTALRAGAKILTGTHDFAAFAANRGKPETDTVRTIFNIRVQVRGPLLTLRYEGTGFLYKMVRLLTGTLLHCAQGRAKMEWIEGLLTSPQSQKTQFAAPAEGLYLTKVLYGGTRSAETMRGRLTEASP